MKVIPKGWTAGIWFIKGAPITSLLPKNFEGIDWPWFKENILESIQRKKIKNKSFFGNFLKIQTLYIIYHTKIKIILDKYE